MIIYYIIMILIALNSAPMRDVNDNDSDSQHKPSLKRGGFHFSNK